MMSGWAWKPSAKLCNLSGSTVANPSFKQIEAYPWSIKQLCRPRDKPVCYNKKVTFVGFRLKQKTT